VIHQSLGLQPQVRNDRQRQALKARVMLLRGRISNTTRHAHEARFQRSPVFVAVFLGLKPQAMMGCTFGAQDAGAFGEAG